VVILTVTTAEFSSDIVVDVTNTVFGGDEGQLLFSSDMEFIHLDGTDISDQFEFSVDCSGEQYSGDGAADLGEGSDGWDYTDDCGECDDNANTDCYDLSLDLHEGANLISFTALPADVSVGNIFSDDAIFGVIGQGVGAVEVNGSWIGSLTSVSQDDGYWVKTSSDASIAHADAEPVNYDADGQVEYEISYGNNLISYPLQTSQSVSDALGDVAGNVYAVAAEGVAYTFPATSPNASDTD
jgi:hypothetical protein